MINILFAKQTSKTTVVAEAVNACAGVGQREAGGHLGAVKTHTHCFFLSRDLDRIRNLIKRILIQN